VSVIVNYLKTALRQLLSIVESATSQVITVPLDLVIGAIQGTLLSLSIGPAGAILKPVSDLICGIEPQLRRLLTCQQGVVSIGRLTDETQCNALADLYRATLEDSVKISPALNLPADASEELRRLTTGSLAVLDLLSKTSIAKTIDDLLAICPSFASDLMQEYRAELLRLSPTEDIRNYTDISLGSVVSFSNSLEACLRVAADPVGALEEFTGASNTEADEDEFEEDDEEKDEGDEQDEQDEQDQQDEQ